MVSGGLHRHVGTVWRTAGGLSVWGYISMEEQYDVQGATGWSNMY